MTILVPLGAGGTTNWWRAPELARRFIGQGLEIVVNTPALASVFFQQEIDRWAKMVAASGAAAD